jgi:hypothetical protein
MESSTGFVEEESPLQEMSDESAMPAKNNLVFMLFKLE